MEDIETWIKFRNNREGIVQPRMKMNHPSTLQEDVMITKGGNSKSTSKQNELPIIPSTSKNNAKKTQTAPIKQERIILPAISHQEGNYASTFRNVQGNRKTEASSKTAQKSSKASTHQFQPDPSNNGKAVYTAEPNDLRTIRRDVQQLRNQREVLVEILDMHRRSQEADVDAITNEKVSVQEGTTSSIANELLLQPGQSTDIKSMHTFEMLTLQPQPGSSIKIKRAAVRDDLEAVQEELKKLRNQNDTLVKILNIHRRCREADVQAILNGKANLQEETKHGLRHFSFDGTLLEKLEAASSVFYMLSVLGGNVIRFDRDVVIRFILTVHKNYRNAMYHNFHHAWSVGHAMFVFLENNRGIFRADEAVGLFVACLCHDLDHRGRTNSFMIKTKSPLAQLYATSVMENHHFAQTEAVLQMEGHDVFQHISDKQREHVMLIIKKAILATDLSAFNQHKTEITHLLDNASFNIKKTSHRDLFQNILMTACDLNSSSKPWTIHFPTSKKLIGEFYGQGIEEKQRGFTPIQMMDITESNYVAKHQIRFLRYTALPCFTIIQRVCEKETNQVEECQNNVEQWQKHVDSPSWQRLEVDLTFSAAPTMS